MRHINQALTKWKSRLALRLDLGELYSRNPTAHKWKAPFRSLMLRETVSWRSQDLIEQSHLLYSQGHLLGARILLRSALETLAMLIYLNQITRNVLNGTLDFHDFSEKTSTLLLGSRDKSTNHQALNIISILSKCNSRYLGISDLYAMLSESAHPNYEGTCVGYSVLDSKNHVTTFMNNWKSMYSAKHEDFLLLFMTVFFSEYDEEWTDAFETLEIWIQDNDAQLELTKRSV